jgi:hypothetical protein
MQPNVVAGSKNYGVDIFGGPFFLSEGVSISQGLVVCVFDQKGWKLCPELLCKYILMSQIVN